MKKVPQRQVHRCSYLFIYGPTTFTRHYTILVLFATSLNERKHWHAKPKRIYLGVSPIAFNGTYSQVVCEEIG